jgi:hypothetical protein
VVFVGGISGIAYCETPVYFFINRRTESKPHVENSIFDYNGNNNLVIAMIPVQGERGLVVAMTDNNYDYLLPMFVGHPFKAEYTKELREAVR